MEGEGLHQITVKSNALRGRGDLTVYCPGNVNRSMPLVILLHGVYGSHWAWTLNGKVHTTASEMIASGSIKPVIMAMPSDGLFGDGSAYVRHKDKDYEKWIVDEVTQVVGEQFPVQGKSFPVFIAGLSMGGFGALRLGSKFPGKFKAFSGLSSITHFDQLSMFVEDMDQLRQNVLVQDGVLDWMIAHRDKLPPFRFDCGREDSLLSHNRELSNRLKTLQIPHIYEEFPGGHSWDYWSVHIRQTLLFFDRFS